MENCRQAGIRTPVSSRIRSSGHKRSAARWGLIHPAALYERGTLVFGRPVWDLITGRSVQSTRPPGPPISALPGRSIRSGLRVAAHSFSRRPIVAIGHIDSVEKLRMVIGCRSRRPLSAADVARSAGKKQRQPDGDLLPSGCLHVGGRFFRMIISVTVRGKSLCDTVRAGRPIRNERTSLRLSRYEAGFGWPMGGPPTW